MKRWAIALEAWPRHLRVFVLVIRVARRTASLLHLVADHRDHGVVGEAPFARAIIVQNVTKPKLALLHRELPRNLAGGGEL
jgi:hypothetical protein